MLTTEILERIGLREDEQETNAEEEKGPVMRRVRMTEKVVRRLTTSTTGAVEIGSNALGPDGGEANRTNNAIL